MSDATEVKSVDLFEWLAERMIRKIEEQPITVEVQLADGSITIEVTPKHPWYKELHRRRIEQAERLRASFKSTRSGSEQ